MGHKIAIRVKPLKQWSDVSNATRHGKREDPAKHVDRVRTHLNQHWRSMTDPENPEKRRLFPQAEPVDIAEAFRDLAQHRGAKWRKGAIVGTEMLFIASPGFFGPPGPRRDEKARRWAEDCLRAVMKRYPRQIAAARLDLDETTPHFSVFMLPTYRKEYAGTERKSTRKPRLTISHNQTFGTPESLSALQDWAAEAMQEAGHALERGEPKATKGADHTTPAEGRRRLQEAEGAARGIRKAAEAEAAQIVSQALSEAEAIRQKAFPMEVRKLREENTDLKRKITAWEGFRDLTREVLRSILPEALFERFRSQMNERWATDPRNPDRRAPDPPPRPAPGSSFSP